MDRNLSATFESTALMLELGVGIAASDGTIDPAELDHLRSITGVTSALTPFERACIRALERLHVFSPPSLTGLGERLKKSLDPAQRMTVARFLVDIATIDRTVDPGERKALSRIFKAMEIDESQLTHLIAISIHPEPDEQPVTVRKGGPSIAGEAIPPQPLPADTIHIDLKRVDDIRRETNDVVVILGGVFVSEEAEVGLHPSIGEDALIEEMEEEAVPGISATSTNPFNDLLPRYVPVLQELLTSNFWTGPDFQELVKKHQCIQTFHYFHNR
jgi:tellurite resistance protein